MNQAWSRSSPAGSAAPVKCQVSSHTSTQEWFPLRSLQSGVPTNRAGTPTDRQAATRRIERPVQVAFPAVMLS